MEDGGSEFRKEAGEEGGAINGKVMGDAWLRFSDAGTSVRVDVGSGTRSARLMRLACL